MPDGSANPNWDESMVATWFKWSTYADFVASVEPNRWTARINLSIPITDANRATWPYLWFYADSYDYPFEVYIQNLTLTDNESGSTQTFPETVYQLADVLNVISSGRGCLCMLPLNTLIIYPRDCTVTGVIQAIGTPIPPAT